MEITIETKVWENDWRLLMTERHLARLRPSCSVNTKAILFINNVEHPERVQRKAEQLVQSGVIDGFELVADHAAKALDHFGLTRESLGAGYYYSIAELVSLFLCTSEFLLHYSGDASPQGDLPDGWLDEMVNVLQTRSDVAVCNLAWDHNYDEVLRESTSHDSRFAYGFGFSDQMYLVRTSDFRAKIYSFEHEASSRYPEYGGELFEKRIDAWMRCNSKLRATYLHGSYVHKNIRRSSLKGLIWAIHERFGGSARFTWACEHLAHPMRIVASWCEPIRDIQRMRLSRLP